MATQPNFAGTPRAQFGQVSAANTALDGTGSGIITLFTGVANGSKIERVRVHAIETTTAGMVRLFIHDSTNYRLFYEIPVSAITPSATVAAFDAEVAFRDLYLPNANWSIRATTHNNEAMNIFVFGGDF